MGRQFDRNAVCGLARVAVAVAAVSLAAQPLFAAADVGIAPLHLGLQTRQEVVDTTPGPGLVSGNAPLAAPFVGANALDAGPASAAALPGSGTQSQAPKLFPSSPLRPYQLAWQAPRDAIMLAPLGAGHSLRPAISAVMLSTLVDPDFSETLAFGFMLVLGAMLLRHRHRRRIGWGLLPDRSPVRRARRAGWKGHRPDWRQ